MKFSFAPAILGRLICFASFHICTTQYAYAQSYHQLTPGDFGASPCKNSRDVVAYTNCSIDFKYKAYEEPTYYRLNFDIHLIFNTNKSWLDKSRITSKEMMEEILKHEQGHYLIAYLEEQELLRTVGKTVFYANYQYLAQTIFNRIDAKYKQLNLDYDADTEHMTNRQQQQSWDAYFKKKLEYMPPE